MFLLGFPATLLGTNCFVVAGAGSRECVVVDPGAGVLERLERVLAEHDLSPAAVLLTHGHLDHVACVPDVLDAHGVRVLIHADDRYRLDDPVGTLSPQLRQMLEQQADDLGPWRAPTAVDTFTDGDVLDLAGLQFTVLHAPGHTEGSVMLRVEAVPDSLPADAGLARTIFSGDVLFNGGVGRTDLPGGDAAVMDASLRDVVLTQPDDSLVFPGHGPATTIGRERATNPYLQGRAV